MSAFDYLLNGFATALQWQNIIFAFVGVLIGTVVGVLPGIGPISGVALLIPVTASLTSGLPPEAAATSAIILLAGVYYGAMYGGSTTSILLNTPGESSSVVTVLDGYPMAKQGRAGVALSIAAIGSFFAGLVSLIGLVFLAEPLSEVALKLSPADEFSLMILGLCALSGLAGKSVTKALMMTVFGLLIATIGLDNVSGVARFTFDMPELYSGLEFLTIAVGVFALGEVFKTILERDVNEGEIAKISRIIPTREDLKESAGPILRGSLVGFFKGIVPGSGATLASFLAYLLEKKISKTPEKFGNGAIAGVAAPESANNAASGGAMIPLLTLGIPGTGTTAVLMGALIMYNVQPGPLLFEDHPTIAWGLIASMFIGNVMLLILNMPLVKVFAKLIETPPKYLIPMIVAISVFGVYAVRVSVFDLVLLLLCGLVGYFLAKHDFPMAPLVLGLVLGPMIENNLRRALTTSNGDFSIFIEKPVSLVFLIIAVLWITVPLIMKMRGKKVIVNEE
ncbi:tripartite tricarboxylate transporter permease [Brevibacillus brevis]|uniref:tripartite tricarboxylate transporter permease n=1 Tax=Brevibacillus brevis TaxID=1393 RepID=UPI001158B0BC|nr:tripartite tricarboxylate transporter permease [Lysinibacillus sp. SDF0063]TQR38612.1 tripartite tricarboxylate transporter permease [Lysinibacillus sp. SDF0063]